ncbi:hypothetical protein Pmar_PMAR001229 [Perkinsus marinus ATCC 50983]|uniref:Uncharacterized protein n=1 Tax=Perkinsus marinus (strain ATCC 50983 / TXsc) TaxID=423536 RepID=C5KT81_PERM5|nr:hypothetical protein Pmar_PMAR001229 [Perkinsus marinus ATCC 50983]EER12431.1 hypothetical protein Pmar_PMAR001229 [Perkinsus marinus ATCC 50983]|eukprot:XP_002780636.1 hypothetical protein Pmar_PMAR001229 [Perkinsus marinus ATCC 50983]
MAESPQGGTAGGKTLDKGSHNNSGASEAVSPSEPTTLRGVLYFNFLDTRMGPAASPREGKSSAAVVDAAAAAASGRPSGGSLLTNERLLGPSAGPRYAFCLRSNVFSQYYISESRFPDSLIIPSAFEWPLELCLVVQPGPGVPFPSTLPWYCGAQDRTKKVAASKSGSSPKQSGKSEARIVGEPLKISYKDAGRGGHMVDRWVQFTHENRLLEVRIQYSVCKAWDILTDAIRPDEASKPAIGQIIKMVNNPAGVLPYALYHVASVANSDKTALILMHAMDYTATLRFFARLSEQEVFRVSAGDRPVRKLLYLFSNIGCFLRAFVTVYRRKQLKEHLSHIQSQIRDLAVDGGKLSRQQRLNRLQTILNRLLEALVDFTTTQLPQHFFHDLDDACRPNFSNSNLVIGGVLCVHVCSAVLAMPRQLEFIGKDDPISPVASGIWLALLRATFLFYLMLSEQVDPARISEFVPDEIYTLVRGVGFDVRAKANIQFQMRILQSRGLQPPAKSDSALESSAAAEMRMPEKAGALLRDMLSEKLYDVTKIIHNRPEFIPQGFSVRELMLQLASCVKARKPEGSVKARAAKTKPSSTPIHPPESDIVQVTPNGVCDRSSIGSFASIVARVEPLFQRSLQWSKRDLIENNIMQGISIVRRTAKPLEALLVKRKPLSQMIAEGRLPKDYIDQLFPDNPTAAPQALPSSPLRRRSNSTSENSPGARSGRFRRKSTSSLSSSDQKADRKDHSIPTPNGGAPNTLPPTSASKSPAPVAVSTKGPITNTGPSRVATEEEKPTQPVGGQTVAAVSKTMEQASKAIVTPATRSQGPQPKRVPSPPPSPSSGTTPLPDLPEDYRQYTGGSNTPVQRGAFTPQKAVATPFLQLLDAFCKRVCGSTTSVEGQHQAGCHTGTIHYFHQYHLHQYHRSVHHNAPQVVQLTNPAPPGTIYSRSPSPGQAAFSGPPVSHGLRKSPSGSLLTESSSQGQGSTTQQQQQQGQQQQRAQRQGQQKAPGAHIRQKKRRH